MEDSRQRMRDGRIIGAYEDKESEMIFLRKAKNEGMAGPLLGLEGRTLGTLNFLS